ncbi:hypothetical protein U1839_18465 [Sphingomonas sp. RT2P30]|uniref:hypothetical protein n=1 Tax=Parasphingomonas halimpatiens TaxID=3096162 RepID=UPI002FC7C962
MIDKQWFDEICKLSGAKLGGLDSATLCDHLGDIEEVLPHIMTIASGFADWPRARAALRAAAKSHMRPTQMRPVMDLGGSVARRAPSGLNAKLNSLLIAESIDWKPDWEERGPATPEIEKMLQSARLQAGDTNDNPELFIEF